MLSENSNFIPELSAVARSRLFIDKGSRQSRKKNFWHHSEQHWKKLYFPLKKSKYLENFKLLWGEVRWGEVRWGEVRGGHKGEKIRPFLAFCVMEIFLQWSHPLCWSPEPPLSAALGLICGVNKTEMTCPVQGSCGKVKQVRNIFRNRHAY